MRITSIKFNANIIRTLSSLIYSKIFKKVNLFFLPNLQKKTFDHDFELNENDVLIKTLLCGYCGTDKKILTFDYSLFSSAFLDTNKHKSKSIYLGHEFVGEVVEVGSNVKDIKIKDKVIMDSVIRNPDLEKSNIFGGFTNYFIKNKEQLEVVDSNINDEKAIFIEPLACSFGAIKEAIIKPQNKILVIGAGIIGQGIIHLLRHMYGKSIKIVVATNSEAHMSSLNKNLIDNTIFKKDIFDESLKILKTKSNSVLNNKIVQSGYDIIFECSGSSKMINKTLRICSKNSQIILVGMNMNVEKIDPTPIWHRNITIKGASAFKKNYPDLKDNTLKFIHNLIKENKIDINNFKVKKISSKNWKLLFNSNNYSSLKKAIFFE